MSNPLSRHWQFTTIAIEDDLGMQVGTGVLVGQTQVSKQKFGELRSSWEPPADRVYLVTARHVLGVNASEIGATLHYRFRYNAATGVHGIEPRRAEFAIKNDPPNWVVHPNPAVDLAALDVTSWISEQRDGHFRFCPLSEVANPVSMLEVECDAGDDVFVLGYPLRLRQGQSNLPIVRKGVLASTPRRSLTDEDGKSLRGFLVDGAIMPGSSGSPVVSTSTRFHPGDLAVTPHRLLLLGIVAQEWGRGKLDRYDTGHSDSTAIEGYANLGFAHSASTIIETIVQLDDVSERDFVRVDHDQRWASQLGIPEWSIEFEGAAVDSTTAFRIMNRLNRDRMRIEGSEVRPDDFNDAPELMGPVAERLEGLRTGGDTFCYWMLYDFAVGPGDSDDFAKSDYGRGVDAVADTNFARQFVLTRRGDFALHDLSIRIHDLDLGKDVHQQRVGELSAPAVYSAARWFLRPNAYYRVFFHARNGSWHQDLQLRKSRKAGSWLAATMVVGGDSQVRFTHVDNGYESEFGQPNWRP